ncbi:MAG: RcnB family protein [Burkholderiales bacterium]
MKSKPVVSAILAMSLATAGIAFGQDRGDRNDRSRKEHVQRADQQDRRHNDRRRDERGAGPDHAFHRGDRLPAEYRHRNYVVNDWRGHHLSAPPRGYHWVQTGGDYVLVAVATGIILQLLLNN